MHFNKYAKEYESAAIFQRDLLEWGLPFMENAFYGKSVLELGAGTGIFTKEILRQGPKELIATDIAPEMVAIGRRGLPDVDWQQMDAWNLNIEARFDVIASSSFLHWSPEPEAVLAKWSKRLMDEGSVEALFFTEGSLKELDEVNPIESPVRWRSTQEWKEIFKRAGFEVVRDEKYQRTYHFQSVQELLKKMRQTGGIGRRRLEYSELKRLIQDYEQKYAKGKSVPSSWNFCYVKAVKA